MKLLILTGILSLFSNLSFSQVDYEKSFQQVLKAEKIGKEYSFRKKDGSRYDSLVLIFLGKVKTDKGRVLKIVTSRWYWGLAHRATSRIIIFNEKNQYMGDYYLTMTYDIPDRLEGNTLIFINGSEESCTPGLVTRVSFKKGIPKRFFLKCKENLGEIYSFEQNL
jgi:hypothetical protein